MGPFSFYEETPRRFRDLEHVEVGNVRVPVALSPSSRLLGLSHLDPMQAGRGLLIPSCSAVHTFGMRFALDLVFLDRTLNPLRVERGVGPRRFRAHSGAWSVLELPSEGGEIEKLTP